MYKMIVAATDGSDASFHAATHAVSLAKLSGAKLVVIYVANLGADVHLGEMREIIYNGLKEEGNRAVNKIVELANRDGVKDVSGIILQGVPKHVIVNWSRENGADLIVVGSRGYSQLTYMVIGSVAEHVVRHAHCPVLVVRK